MIRVFLYKLNQLLLDDEVEAEVDEVEGADEMLFLVTLRQ
jgi:hypothetical protein